MSKLGSKSKLKHPKSGGLLGALLGDGHPGVEQRGGADSYGWHRADSGLVDEEGNSIANARSHLQTVKQLPWEDAPATGESKRAAWLEEVRAVMYETGMNWRDSLKEASRRRKQTTAGYQTVVERVKTSYTGRTAENVNCTEGKRCPGRYTKPVARGNDGDVTYRPNAHNVSRANLSRDAASNLLREYYKQRSGQYKGGLKGATKAMRQDIGKKNRSRKVQSPCPTKLITVHRKDGKTYQRRIVDRQHPDYAECRSNWLYRATPRRFDMESVDFGDGDSPAYGINKLPKTRKDKGPEKTKKPSKRLQTSK